MKLDKFEKKWFLVNGICWPLIILGIWLAVGGVVWLGVPLVGIPFYVICYTMAKEMLGF